MITSAQSVTAPDSIDDQETFRRALLRLPADQQRRIAARFIGNVLELAHEPELTAVQAALSRAETQEREIDEIRRVIGEIHARSHPDRMPGAVDYRRHAAYLVLEALMLCAGRGPDDRRRMRCAEQVAAYCRLARLCAGLAADRAGSCRGSLERRLQQEIRAQFRMLSGFLAEKEPGSFR
jgi:hypothetical protein